jgi:hypothetical protein
MLFGEEVDQAYFVFNEASDDDVKTFIDELVSVNNTVNRKVGGNFISISQSIPLDYN